MNRLQNHLDRLSSLESGMNIWLNVWKNIRDFISPMIGQFSDTDMANRGDLRMDKIVDSTPLYACRILVNGLHSGLCSPSRRWFAPNLDDQELLEWGPAKNWTGAVEKIMYAALSQSNFYQAQAAKYAELGPFGTGCCISEESTRHYFRFQPLTIGTYFISEGPDGLVDTLYRKVNISAKTAYQRWGEKLSDNVKRQVNENSGAGRWSNVEIIHVIEPRKLRDTGKRDNKNMPFASLYFEKAESSRGNILEESGFNENPIHCTRWATTGSDVWGRGPGHEVLPDSMMLQEMAKTEIMQLHKQANPPVAVPSGFGESLNLLPGGQNRYSGDKPGLIHPIFQSQPDLRGFMMRIDAKQKQIEKGFYNDLFLLLASLDNGKNVTAEFVRDISKEKLLLLGPVVERLVYEDLQTSLERVYGILVRAGAFPAPPKELEGREIRWQFLSTLAMAQKLAATQSIEAVAKYVMSVAQMAPQVVDKFNVDQSVDEYGEAVLAPVGIINPDDEVEQIRQQRAKQQEEQQKQEQAMIAAQQAEQLSKAGKTMAETVPQQGSALEKLEQMMEGMGGQ
jgi:hypothetical protein